MKAVRTLHQAGRYKHLVSIDRLKRTVDSLGAPIEQWLSIGEFPAFVDKITGSEFFDGYLVLDRINYYIEFRHNASFNTLDRLSFIDSFGIRIHLDIFLVADDREQGRFIGVLGLVRDKTQGATGTPAIPPKVISSQILETDHKQIKVVFDVPVKLDPTVVNKMFNILIGAGLNISEESFELDPTNNAILHINLLHDLHAGDVIVWNIIQSHFIRSTVGNADLGTHTHGVSNLIAHGQPVDRVPVVLSSIIDNADPTVINVTFDVDMQHTAHIHNAIDIMKNGHHENPLSAVIQADKRTLKITLQNPVIYHEVLTWAYNDQHPTETLESLLQIEAENQTYNIVNNVLEVHVHAITPILQSAEITTIAGSNTLSLTFNTPMEGTTQKIISETVIHKNGQSITPSAMNNNDKYIRYTFTDKFIAGDVVTIKISNLGATAGQLQTVTGQIPFTTAGHEPVSNQLIAPVTAFVFEDNFDTNTLSNYVHDGTGSAQYNHANKFIDINAPQSYAGLSHAIGQDLKDFTFEAKITGATATTQLIIYLYQSDTDYMMIRLGSTNNVELRGAHKGSVIHNSGLALNTANQIKISGNNDHVTIKINNDAPHTVSIASFGANLTFKKFKLYMLHLVGTLDDIQIQDHA